MSSSYLIGIVDDDPDIPDALSSLVRSLGHRVECFGSAVELFERQSLSDFSCIISDIHMPVISGIELTRKLQGIAPTLPVILMTGRPESGLPEQARIAGAIAFVTKPFSIDALEQSLSDALCQSD